MFIPEQNVCYLISCLYPGSIHLKDLFNLAKYFSTEIGGQFEGVQFEEVSGNCVSRLTMHRNLTHGAKSFDEYLSIYDYPF